MSNYCKNCYELQEQLDQLKAENEKLKQTITSVRDVAEKHAPRCNDNADCDYECEACHLRDLKQILQKISEVEDG